MAFAIPWKTFLVEAGFGWLLCFGLVLSAKNCNQPLGMQNGAIQDNNLTSGPVFNNDTFAYGPQLARLNSPEGYRGNLKNPGSSWMAIGIGHSVVVTGIATQGFGNASVKEWVTRFSLLYSKDGDTYKPVRDIKSKYAVFLGNKDSETIHRQNLPFPIIASTIMFLPMAWNKNVGLRIEIYGCELDFYFKLYLLFAKQPFTMALRRHDSYQYKVAKEEALEEVNTFPDHVPGFLDFVFKGFSPQESVVTGQTNIAVELDIYCIESKLLFILAKLKEQVRSSDLFESDFFKLKYPKSKICPPPDLNILPMKDASKTLTVLKRSMPVFHAQFQHQCNSKQHLITWKTGVVDEESGIMSPFMLQPVTSYNLTLVMHTFQSSLIFLQCTTYITVGDETSYLQDYKFVRIINSHLVPYISAPGSAFHGGSDVILDASRSTASGDPGFLDNLFLKFSWYCSFTSIQLPGRKGCFNESANKSFSNKEIVRFDVDKLDVGQYDFLLEVSSANVKVKARHRLRVGTYTEISIRCVSNCLGKINPNKKQVLRSKCSGVECPKTIKYYWIVSLYNTSKSQWEDVPRKFNTESILQQGSTFTVNNFSDLIGFKNVRDELYKVKVMASLNEFVQIIKEEQFILNAVPESSNASDCTITPSHGLAMDTIFRISCEDWRDEDLPLTFKFQYISVFGLMILNSGLSPTVSKQLLPGSNITDFVINVTLIISDRYGASQTIHIPVKVMMPSEQEAKNKIKNINNELDDLVKKGDLSKAADVSLYTLTLMKAYSQDENTETKVKDDILSHVSAMNITSLDSSLKCAALVKPSTEQARKLSPQTQSNALELIEKVTSVLSSEVDARNETSGITFESAEFFADGVIGGLSNIIDPVFEDQIASNEKLDTDYKDEAKKTKSRMSQIPQRTIAMVTKVAQTMSSIATVGDGPKTIKTKNIAVRVEKDFPKSFDGKVIKQAKSLIKLPPLKDVLSNVNGTVEVMGCQVVEYKNNPFDWHSSAKSVRTGILDVNLSDNEKKINVDLLENPISLYLPHNAADGRNEVPRTDFFLTPVHSISDMNSTKNMNYHMIYLPSKKFVAGVKVVPERGIVLEVYVRAGGKPTPRNYSYFKIIPDLSSCRDKPIEKFNLSHCLQDPYKFVFTSNTTGSIGLHYIGIRSLKRPTHGRSKRSEDVTQTIAYVPEMKSRSKRSEHQELCVKVKDPTILRRKIAIPVYNRKTDINYTLNTLFSACMFWSEKKEEWETRGCKLGGDSNSSHVHCLCDHMTAFGGDFFVAPNPIDFQYILAEFSNLEESGNYVVLTTVVLMWTAYFAGLIFARRADLLDKMKIINCTINCSDKQVYSKKTYKISIQTGLRLGSGTTASVALILHGVEGSLPIYLNNDDPEKLLFARGSVNTYWVTTSEDIGEIFKIKIWHNNKGKNPSWFVSDIMVEDENSSGRWYFLVNKWLAIDKEGIVTDVKLTDEMEEKNLKNRFYARAALQYSNSHLWLSLFTKSVHSPFTRCQRLSCCFLILTSTMIANAMFYQFSSESAETYMIGPFEVSLRSIKTGIQSAIITLPINVLAALIFEKVKSKRTFIDKGLVLHEENIQGFVPRCFVPVAWFLCIAGSVAASVFTIFYSLMWGVTVSNQWLSSTIISFSQDVIINQPIKIFILVSLLAMIIKKPVDSRNDVNTSEERKILESHKIETPPKNVLVTAREILEATSIAKTFVVEIAFYTLFACLTFVVCYGNINTDRFQQTSSMQPVGKNFHEVKDTASFWVWLQRDAIPFLFNQTWYNGMSFEGPEGFVSNKYIYLIGMPRLRQLRVKSDNSCLVDTPRELQHFFRTCIQEYSFLTEDRTAYSLPGWRRYPVTASSKQGIDNFCPKPWRYSSFTSIQTLPYMGNDIVYGGGGFIADLGYSISTALNVAANLKESNWIDDKTAAVFLEFTVFSPTTMLFSSVKLLFERFPFGAASTAFRIYTFQVYSTTNKILLQVCQFFLMITVITAIGMEISLFLIQRAKYFQDIWNLVQWLQIGTIVAAIAMSSFKEKYTSNFLKRVKENPFQTSSSDYIVLWTDLETVLLSFVIFILTIKLLRIVRFNNFVLKLYGSMKGVKNMLAPLCVLFIIVVMALSLMAFILFGHYIFSYSTYIRTVMKLVHQLAGGKLFQRATNFSENTMGIFFGMLYASTTSIMLVNVLISAIIESWTDIDRNKPKSGVKPMDIIKSWIKRSFLIHKAKSRRKNLGKKYAVLEINERMKHGVHVLEGKTKLLVVYEQNPYNNGLTNKHKSVV